MAVVNTKATAVSNLDAQPKILNNGWLDGGSLRTKRGTVEKAAGDSNASVYRFFRIRSTDVLSSLEIFNDAQAGCTDNDVGLYRTAKDGGAVVDADIFADGISLASASTTGTNITFSVTNIDKIEKRVWELLGLSADPYLEYDVCLTSNTTGGVAGTISLRASVIGGN